MEGVELYGKQTHGAKHSVLSVSRGPKSPSSLSYPSSWGQRRSYAKVSKDSKRFEEECHVAVETSSQDSRAWLADRMDSCCGRFLLTASECQCSSFLLLVEMPGATSSVLAPSSVLYLLRSQAMNCETIPPC